MRTTQFALAPVGSADTTSSLHLTRRGRFLLLGLPVLTALAVVLVGLMMLASTLVNQSQASSAPAAGVEAEVVTVDPGDTLWSVAAGIESEERTQVLIGQIAELNDLENSTLQPGQELFVPVP